MTEKWTVESDRENCHHCWIYDHQSFDDVFLRCPRCGLVRISYPGEIVARVARELRIRHDGEDGDV